MREKCVTIVEIYTKASCGFCVRAKRLLDMKKIEYREIAVEDGGATEEELVQRAGGRTTVPQIFIDGAHIGGCDALMTREYDGKLDALLAA